MTSCTHHMACKYLWLFEIVDSESIDVIRVDTKINIVDIRERKIAGCISLTSKPEFLGNYYAKFCTYLRFVFLNYYSIFASKKLF
jgi:hypothetical protein